MKHLFENIDILFFLREIKLYQNINMFSTILNNYFKKKLSQSILKYYQNEL